VKTFELSVAVSVAALDMSKSADTVGPDAAAAICIGKWAIRSGEVLAKLPKSRRAA
jgi:hypothetical protein